MTCPLEYLLLRVLLNNPYRRHHIFEILVGIRNYFPEWKILDQVMEPLIELVLRHSPLFVASSKLYQTYNLHPYLINHAVIIGELINNKYIRELQTLNYENVFNSMCELIKYIEDECQKFNEFIEKHQLKLKKNKFKNEMMLKNQGEYSYEHFCHYLIKCAEKHGK